MCFRKQKDVTKLTKKRISCYGLGLRPCWETQHFTYADRLTASWTGLQNLRSRYFRLQELVRDLTICHRQQWSWQTERWSNILERRL